MPINSLTIMGNFVRDPILKVTTGGTSICDFKIAHNRKFTDKSGVERDEVTFLRCQSFNKTAKNINAFFEKGKPILLEGRLKEERWEKEEEGMTRQYSALKLVVECFHFLPSSQPTASQPTASQPTASQPTASQPTASQPTASQPAASQPTASQPTASQPAASQPAASQPAASQPAAYGDCPQAEPRTLKLH